MKTVITARHTPVSVELRRYIEERVKKIEKFFTPTAPLLVILKTEKYRHDVEMIAHIRDAVFQAEAETKEMQAAVDQAVSKLEAQLKRSHDKNTRSKRTSEETIRHALPVIKSAKVTRAPLPSKIRHKMARPLRTMTREEAESAIEDKADALWVFIESRQNRVCVLHRKKDGTLTLIETEEMPKRRGAAL